MKNFLRVSSFTPILLASTVAIAADIPRNTAPLSPTPQVKSNFAPVVASSVPQTDYFAEGSFARIELGGGANFNFKATKDSGDFGADADNKKDDYNLFGTLRAGYYFPAGNGLYLGISLEGEYGNNEIKRKLNTDKQMAALDTVGLQPSVVGQAPKGTAAKGNVAASSGYVAGSPAYAAEKEGTAKISYNASGAAMLHAGFAFNRVMIGAKAGLAVTSAEMEVSRGYTKSEYAEALLGQPGPLQTATDKNSQVLWGVRVGGQISFALTETIDITGFYSYTNYFADNFFDEKFKTITANKDELKAGINVHQVGITVGFRF